MATKTSKELIDDFDDAAREYYSLLAKAIIANSSTREPHERLVLARIAIRTRLADLERESADWKKRDAQHGCNTEEGDDDCG